MKSIEAQISRTDKASPVHCEQGWGRYGKKWDPPPPRCIIHKIVRCEDLVLGTSPDGPELQTLVNRYNREQKKITRRFSEKLCDNSRKMMSIMCKSDEHIELRIKHYNYRWRLYVNFKKLSIYLFRKIFNSTLQRECTRELSVSCVEEAHDTWNSMTRSVCRTGAVEVPNSTEMWRLERRAMVCLLLLALLLCCYAYILPLYMSFSVC